MPLDSNDKLFITNLLISYVHTHRIFTNHMNFPDTLCLIKQE